jgi:prepilin-type processing-associated H-X9-DG protein
VGKRYVAHVVFADGHVDALLEPSKKTSSDEIKLTRRLCMGDEIDQDILDQMH